MADKNDQTPDEAALAREAEKQKALADAQVEAERQKALAEAAEQAAKNRLDEGEEGGHYILANGTHVNAEGEPLKAKKDSK